MRFLHSHEVGNEASKLVISVQDEPGAGGANHHYMIGGFDTSSNASDPFQARHGTPALYATVLFQHGTIPEKGLNGVTHEALLAILIDRLRTFQAGSFKCRENAIVLTHLEDAMHWLHHRTIERTARNVEGTHNV